MKGIEAVIFMGIQASGKTTFYQRNFFQTHMHINLDMLRTRYREQIFLRACIEAKQKFVVDNTNPTKEDRMRYIEPAKKAGFYVVGYYFESCIKACVDRNQQREGMACVSDKAIAGTHKKLELPSYAEGFDALYYVRIEKKTFQIEKWNEEGA